MHEKAKTKTQRSTLSKVVDVIGLVILILTTPIVVANLILIYQSIVNPNVPPSIFGNTPLVVTSGSMTPEIGADSYLIVKAPENSSALETGTVISYLSGNGVITHRIVEVQYDEDGNVSYITQGDANNNADSAPVSPSQIIGVYRFHIEKLGAFVLFMQTTPGILIFVAVPSILIFAYFAVRSHLQYKALIKQIADTKSFGL